MTSFAFCLKLEVRTADIQMMRTKILHTLLVKHYNDLLDKQSYEQSRDEVTYFYVGDVFCIHFGTMYADFQEKIFAEISGKMFQTFHCSNVTTMKSLGVFPRYIREYFFWKWAYMVPRCIQKTSPTLKYVTSSLLRPEICLSSKSL